MKCETAQIRFGCGHREMKTIVLGDKWDRVEPDGSGGVIVEHRDLPLCSCCQSIKDGDGVWRRAQRGDMTITYPPGRVRISINGECVYDGQYRRDQTQEQAEADAVTHLTETFFIRAATAK